MGNIPLEGNNYINIILCPLCLRNIPSFRINPPFIFYWCRCFSENKENNIYNICQWKKINYINYINIIKNINFSEIDKNILTEITNCEKHPNNKEILYGVNSKEIKCELCKNPGEHYISIEEHFNLLKDDINKQLNPEMEIVLKKGKNLLCQIYNILINELKKYKIINSNIIKSFKSLVQFIKNNENKLMEISEQIEKYIPINESPNFIKSLNNTIYKFYPKFKIDKKNNLINIEQTLSDHQTFIKDLGNGIIYQILLFNNTLKKEENNTIIINNNYSIVFSISIGNTKRGDMQCAIYNYTLFPFRKKIQYKKPNQSFRFSEPNLSLSKYGNEGFICMGNTNDFSPLDSILIYSINVDSPIISIPIDDKYIILKTILNEKEDISFLYLSQDKTDFNFPGGEESGHRYINLYNKNNSLIYKGIINNIFHGQEHFCNKTISLYIKKNNFLIILFGFNSYSNTKNKSLLLFYNINERTYKLLSYENFIQNVEKNNSNSYIISICSNDDFLLSLNSEKVIQKWDCKTCTCVDKFNINLDENNKILNNLMLLKTNDNFEKIIIKKGGEFRYYYRNKDNFVEGMTITIAVENNSECAICEIEDFYNISNRSLFVVNDKKFYIIQNI